LEGFAQHRNRGPLALGRHAPAGIRAGQAAAPTYGMAAGQREAAIGARWGGTGPACCARAPRQILGRNLQCGGQTMRMSAFLVTLSLLAGPALAQTAPSGAPASTDDKILLTVFLKHDQAMTLEEINEKLKKQGYYDRFPPAGVEVDSWYVVMGIGQVVTLRLPPEKLREVNRVLEETAWGAYRTEFFPTYDYKQLALQQKAQMQQKK
jgi:hypothetical protein